MLGRGGHGAKRGNDSVTGQPAAADRLPPAMVGGSRATAVPRRAVARRRRCVRPTAWRAAADPPR
ncbi:hypothetical protein ISF6_5294 [Piscinibacter sakaiensis]|uniref:Uncharacterized protein n=1 Tax=Piscinibacter sakaiensis TaxID=1547922 RepID=A0A0K8P7Y6_PISS1|nr:hypothetical protein ISF6_5294 [Piscinibacter sakaiensis]